MRKLISRRALLRILILAALCYRAAMPAWAQQPPAPTYNVPLGIALEEFSYPFTVRYLSLQNDGQPVRMAYMDVWTPPAQAAMAVPPTAPTSAVLLLHGKNFYGSYWQNTIRALAAAGHRVIVPDQIGFGKSSKPDLSLIHI